MSRAYNMRLNSFYFALLGVLLYHSSIAVVFKFTNIVCESYNKSWFQFHECRLKAVSRDRVLMNAIGTILHPVYNAQTQSKLFKRESGYSRVSLTLRLIHVDLCESPISPLLRLFIVSFTNINHSCPYVVYST